MTKEEYQDFVLRYKGCGACFPLYEKLSKFEKMWFTAIQKDVAELKQQIEQMRCCENCKYNSYWGNELHCNYGLKEALQEDKLVECNKMDKWEIKDK